MTEEDDTLTEDEFRTWYTPAEALESVDWRYNRNISKPLILKRIMESDMLVAARRVRLVRHGEELERHAFKRVLGAILTDDASSVLKNEHFWATGDIILFVDEDRFGRATEFSCTEVRLDPVGVRALIPPPRQEPEAPAPSSPSVLITICGFGIEPTHPKWKTSTSMKLGPWLRIISIPGAWASAATLCGELSTSLDIQKARENRDLGADRRRVNRRVLVASYTKTRQWTVISKD